MPEQVKKVEKKCIVIHVSVDLLEKIDCYMKKSGKGKNTVLIEILEKGFEHL